MEIDRVLHYSAFTAPDGRGGNAAGVVLDADDLDDAERQAIAAALGYSETAFVERSAPDGVRRLRYFSPQAEVDFCGHATVAAAVALAEAGTGGPLHFEINSGRVDVTTQDTPEGRAATLTSVPARTRPAEPDELAAALAALRWTPADLDPRYPPHVAYAGNEHLVLAVRDQATLAALDYDYAALAALMADRGWTTVHLVRARTSTSFAARDPFPPGGVVEDAATGAAAAAFGGYLRELGLVPLPARLVIDQGVEMGRPSRLYVDVAEDDPRVRVTGVALRTG